MEESHVKSTCGGLRLIVQNLTRCRKVDLKSDQAKKNLIKIWQHEKIFTQNHALYKNFFVQNHAS